MSQRLLIIDPDLDITMMLQIYFENAGYEVNPVKTGQEGISEARSWKPSIILINGQVNDIPVNVVCQDILTHALTSHIPIILLLKETDRRSKLEALEIGVDDIVTRPFDIEELKLRIEAVIRLASYRSTNEHKQ